LSVKWLFVLTFAGHAILAGVLGENPLTRCARIVGDGSGAYLAMDNNKVFGSKKCTGKSPCIELKLKLLIPIIESIIEWTI